MTNFKKGDLVTLKVRSLGLIYRVVEIPNSMSLGLVVVYDPNDIDMWKLYPQWKHDYYELVDDLKAGKPKCPTCELPQVEGCCAAKNG